MPTEPWRDKCLLERKGCSFLFRAAVTSLTPVSRNTAVIRNAHARPKFRAKIARPPAHYISWPSARTVRENIARVHFLRVYGGRTSAPYTKNPYCLRKLDFRPSYVDKDIFYQWCFAPSSFVLAPKTKIVNEAVLSFCWHTSPIAVVTVSTEQNFFTLRERKNRRKTVVTELPADLYLGVKTKRNKTFSGAMQLSSEPHYFIEESNKIRWKTYSIWTFFGNFRKDI